MRIAVCDDDSMMIVTLKAHIQAWAQRNKQQVAITSYESAESFLLNWTSPTMFNLLFLDIKMSSMSGMELAEVIRKVDSEMAIVFVTADRDSILQGYTVNALHYLIKPISEEDCSACLSKVKERLVRDDTSALVVQTDGRLMRIRYDDIMYFESISHYLHVHSTKEEVRYRKNIGEAEEELSGLKEFVRIHRSYLVNLRYVSSVEDNDVVLENNEKLRVSRTHWRDTYRAFVRYYADA